MKRKETRRSSLVFAAAASVFFGLAAMAHVLEPALGHPMAHLYDALSPRGRAVWDTTLAVLFFGALLAVLIKGAVWLTRWAVPKFSRRSAEAGDGS